MLILGVGDSVRSQTGYARVSQHVYSHFLKRGHSIIQIGWHHSEPPENVAILEDGGKLLGTVPMFPPFTKDESAAASTLLFNDTNKPDMIYCSNDIYTTKPLIDLKKSAKYPMFITDYGVIDSPKAAELMAETIREINVLVTPSKYGYEQLKHIVNDGLYIPHGVSTSMYKPLSSKEACKENLKMGGKFVYGCVNRNITRKMMPFVIESFANLKYRHGLKDIVLMPIMDPTDNWGYDLNLLAKKFKLSTSWDLTPAAIMFHPQHLNWMITLTEEQLAVAYNAFDVLVSASLAEGFGLPTIESQACGTPVIACDHSANTELVEGHGWLYPTVKNIDGAPAMWPSNQPTPLYNYPIPDKYALEMAMLEAYNKSEMREDYGKKAHAFAQDYDWNKVLPLWDQVLSRAEDFRGVGKK